MQCSFLFRYYLSVSVFCKCFMNQSSCFGLEFLGDIWIDAVIHVEMRAMDAAIEHVSRCQSFCMFTNAHCWFSHPHTRTQSLCWPAYEIPLGLSSLLHFSPLSLLAYSSVHLILSFLLHWGKRRFVTHYLLLPNDGRLSGEDYPLTVSEKTALWWPWPWGLWRKMGDKRWEQRKSAAPNMKLENSWWCCLRMFWRCGGMWTTATLTVCSLPLSRSLSFFTWLLSEPTASAFEIQRPFFSSFSPSPFVRESLFVQTRWGHTEVEEKHLHCLTELRHFLKAPKSHGKG